MYHRLASILTVFVLAIGLAGCPTTITPVPEEPAEDVRVPNVTGMTQSQASSTITAADLNVGSVTMEFSETVPSGRVISQNPVAGSTVAMRTPVRIVLSAGPRARTVPNVVGATRAEAEAALAAAGLTVGAVTMQFNETIPAGEIISQDPPVGSSAGVNGTVTLVVSLGPVVTVPNVVGRSAATAIETLTVAGLQAGNVTLRYNDTIPAAQVMSQDPAAGAGVARNTPVAMVVSRGLEPVPVPNVVGLVRSSAEALIASNGFTTGVVTEVFSETIASGRVISQSPEAGAILEPNSAIGLVVSKGPEPTIVPAVVGLPRSTAEAAIVNAELVVGTVVEQFSNTVPNGQVISQSPAANTSVAKNSAVSLVVSKGVEMITVPDVIGLERTVAQTAILNARLSVGGVTEQFHDLIPIGHVVSQTPTANSSVVVNASVSLVISKGPESSEITVTVGSGGATVDLDLATLVVPAQALGANVEITMSRNRRGEQVQIGPNEQVVSQVYTIEQAGALPIPSSAGRFMYTLDYDPSVIALGESDVINDTTLFFRVTTATASFRLSGIVSGNAITIPFDTLPTGAALQIVYNPNMRATFSSAAAKTLTQNPDWRTTRFRVTYDVADSELRQAVAGLREVLPANLTESMIAETLRDTAANNARDAALYYQGLGLREANLRVAGSGASAFFDLHVGTASATSHYADQGITWGQINFDVGRLDGDVRGTVRNAIAHELFHAVFDGYDLNHGPNNGYQLGLTETLASLLGQTLDADVITPVPGVPHSLSVTIGQFGTTCTETACTFVEADARALGDWFAYVGKRFNSGSLAYLGGNGDFAAGLLEQIRTQSAGQPPADVTEAQSQLLRAMHAAFEAQFGQPLGEVYWDYARNRAYEHNDESRLRAGDASIERFTLDTVLFDAAHVREYTLASDEQILTLTPADVGALQSIPPMATRAVVFTNGGGFNSDLLLTFNQEAWEPDEFGNSMLVKVYKDGFDGVELPAGENEVFLTGFGDPDADPAFSSVVVLLSNVSVDQLYSVQMRANTTVATGGLGSLAGRATNADTEAPLSGVQVDVRGRNYGDSDAVIAETVTDGNGEFMFAGLPSGYVEFTFSLGGHVTTIQTATVISDTTNQMSPSIIVAGSANDLGTTSGQVIDTVSGIGVSGVALDLRSGILQLRDTDYPVVTAISTDASGGYSFANVNAGTYTVFTQRAGYVNDTFVIYVIGGETRTGQNGDISLNVGAGETRIVLTWGEMPFDLDSHLTGPLAGGGRFHVYYADPTAAGADLDLDDVTSFGPETTTIRTRIAGTYRFSVHDWSNLESSTSSAMSNSGANVKVFTEAGLIEFNITPNTPATLWTVFEMDGATGAITTVNQYSFQSAPNAVTEPLGFRYGIGSESPTIVQNLPAK